MKYLKYILLTFLGLIIFSNAFGQVPKRGIAYGHHSPEDLAILSPNVSWWYNWSEIPESTVADVYTNYGFDFVPMTWNGNFDETKLRAFLSSHPETKYLLAFNEPNFLDQANMTPSAAAAQWPRLEAIANEFNLKIVAPAVNYCGSCVQENGITYTDPYKYLDDFFVACPDCRVDYIAVHCYMNTVSALQWYINGFKKYNRPVWLTEFAGWEQNGNINKVDDQINFMIGAVDFLESEPSIYRYSWFIGRGSGIYTYPYIDLLGSNGKLTVLGEIYKQMPVHDDNHLVNIPGTIEAEAYNKMSGILIEKTADDSGFANVGYINAGDWLEYKINVLQSENYDIKFRIASTKSSGFQILIDGSNALSQSVPNTNGWQNWSTVSNKLNLISGEHTIRLVANSDGFNINWIQIGNNPLTIRSMELETNGFIIFPNPGKGIFNIKTDENYTRLQVLDLLGCQLVNTAFTNQLDLGLLKPGIYT